MAKQTSDNAEIEERLAEALAQIESLQAATADAEARAKTAGDEARMLKESEAQVRGELDGARGQLRDAAVRYRTARLASAPDVPGELVPEAETLDEIDAGLESAQRLVGQVREKVEGERRGASRVPAGSPARRAQDLSSLPASEKIKLGLQQLSEREGR